MPSVRFVEIDEFGNEREIGTARNYNISSSSTLTPISGFGNQPRLPETTIEVEGFKTPVSGSPGSLVSFAMYDAVESRLEAAKAELAESKKATEGMTLLVCALVHMMGGAVSIHKHELDAAGAFTLDAEEKFDPPVFMITIEETP